MDAERPLSRSAMEMTMIHGCGHVALSTRGVTCIC